MNTQENNTLYPHGDYDFDLWFSPREPSAPSHSGNTHTSHSRSPILSSPTRPSSRTPSAQSPHSTPQPQLVKRKRKSLTPQPPSHSPSKRVASVAQTPQRSPTPKLQNASTAIGSPHEPKAATNKGRQVKPLYGQGGGREVLPWTPRSESGRTIGCLKIPHVEMQIAFRRSVSSIPSVNQGSCGFF